MFTDEEIIHRILDGEDYLYEALIRKYNQRLYRISRSIVHDEDEVEDIMQSAYLNAYLNLAGFKGKSTFATWLTKILINESLLHKKRRAKRSQVLLEKQDNNYDYETPLSSLMNSELKAVLEESIAKLPEKYRLVFVMRELEDMSTNETMGALGLTESNVKVRLNRAKEMLRDVLSGHYKSSAVYDFHLTRCDKIVNRVMTEISSAIDIRDHKRD
ncbi:MAG: RNA polymerase sigma factor [Imperialibacter sp.]|uniref:RNA polymerase sigma factor n=1 Tax=Imperialibacter sp. TaxID=2038411 RepID=UPI0032EC4279